MTAFTTVSIIVVAILSVSNAFVSMKQSSFSRRGDLSMDGGRIPLVAGNWKMNTDLGSAIALATELAELTASADGSKVEIAVCPPFPFLRDVKMVTYFIPSAHISWEFTLNLFLTRIIGRKFFLTSVITWNVLRLWRTRSPQLN